MSRISYYYSPQSSTNIVREPGLVCDYCGKLSKIEKEEGSTMIPMPMTAIDEEYGREEGDIHAHPSCALKVYKRMKLELRQMEKELKKRKII